MEFKKNPQDDLKTKKGGFIKISLVLALVLILVPFENKTYDEGIVDLGLTEMATTRQEVSPAIPQEPSLQEKQPIPLNFTENDVANRGKINIDEEPPKKIEIAEPRETFVQEAEIFLAVEDPPQFPGGEAARHNFIQENTKYPQKANGKGIQGTVYVTFVVEPNGSLSGIKVLRGIGSGCDEEAVRVVSIMPKWQPGKQKGQAVRVQLNMPIKFVL